jgi:carbon-monoxide dehydrogenase medium subunit
MTNSHLLVEDFDYHEPASLPEAFALMERYGEGARLMAGGTHLLVMMKMEREIPQAVINLAHIPGLSGIHVRPGDGALRIGACTPIRAVFANPLVRARYAALAEACASFGSTQIQSMGTIGGNICNGSPAADSVPALLAFQAELELVSTQGERCIPLADFLLGPGRVDLHPGEVLSAVVLPPTPEGASSLFIKITRVAADLAKASLAVYLERDGDRIATCRLTMGSVAPTVKRLSQAEAALNGQVYAPELLAQAGRLAAAEISPIDDTRSEAWYRRELAGVLLQDGISEAWQRCRQGWQTPYPELPSNGHHPARPSLSLEASERKEITLTVNGHLEKLWVSPNELLLNVLRERLELTGTKYGCGVGECGACTIHLDGKPALACLTLAVAADGRRVTTIEGLQNPATGALDPLQQAFIDEAAFQCGYCTPGILMATKSLLAEIPHPSEQDVREYLKGNRCRCTGYASIMRAVLKSVKA